MVFEHRTKIVCTVGPSTEDDDVLREMMRSGMTVARLNFSHGSHEYHQVNIERVRRLADEIGADVAIMVDTKGPEIRTAAIADHKPVVLVSGQDVTVTTRPVYTSYNLIALDYKNLPKEVGPGSVIYVDDGLVELRVEYVMSDTDIRCTALNSGAIGEHKGVNVPNVFLGLPSVTEQDRKDLQFACEMGADAVAVSFVRDADAVREVREICEGFGCPEMLVISKIESSLALKNLDSIVRESDGIMVARGDLGVEIPAADVPGVQKDIILMCNELHKPVITATQMLESMTHNPRPTRAEVTDVANAIYDGTDCVMLSGETAAGDYPAEAVKTMSEICKRAESRLPAENKVIKSFNRMHVSEAASIGAVEMAKRVGATAIVCPTFSGHSARVMSSLRPDLPIIAVTPSSATVKRTCFSWGVVGFPTTMQDGLDRICYNALKVVRASGLVHKDDLVVITAGDPVTSPLTDGTETSTNMCLVAQVFGK